MPHAPHCRSCGESSLESILKWDRPPVVTSPLNSAVAASTGGCEELSFCPRCTLVQRIPTELTRGMHEVEFAPRAELASWPTRQLTSQILANQKLRPTSLVIQIGSRDGRMLTEYQAAGVPVLGIEPAVRLAELARLEHGVPTLCRFFDSRLATHLLGCGQPADVVHLHYTLPLIADLDVVIAGLPIVLKDSGVVVIESPYVRHLLDRATLWSPHHGELSYFSLTSLSRLLTRHGLVVHDAERAADGGASLRLFVGKRGATSSRVTELLSEEQGWGVERLATYLPRRRAKVA